MTGEKRAAPALCWWGVVIALALIAGTVVWYLFPTQPPATDFSVPLPIASTPVLPPLEGDTHDIELDALLNAMRNSIPKSQVMYDGQCLRVKGALDAVGVDETGRCYVELTAADGRMRFLLADGTDLSVLSTIPVGRTVLITGVCHVGEEMTFTDCRDLYLTPEA